MRHADRTVALTVQVEGLVEQLQGGAWRGVGAEAFYAEMRDLILPAMRKLEDALQFAGEGTGKIHHLLREAEEEAARLFRGEGEVMLPTRSIPISAQLNPQQDDGNLSEKERQLYDALIAFLALHRNFHLKIWGSILGRDPTFEEILAFWLEAQSLSPEDHMWRLILSNIPAAIAAFGYHGTVDGLPHLVQAILDGIQGRGRSPEDYAKAFEAFRIWLGEEGIRLNDTADILKSFEDWTTGKGAFWGVLLAALPLSSSALGRILNQINSRPLREALERLVKAGNHITPTSLLDAINQHGGDVAIRNLSRLQQLAGNDFLRLLSALRSSAIVELMTNPAFLSSLPDGADLTTILRHINATAILNTLPDLEHLIPHLSTESLQRLLTALDAAPNAPTMSNLARLIEGLGAENAARILNRLQEVDHKRLIALLTDPNYAAKYILPTGANARFFDDTFPYNGFRELYGSGDVPADVTDIAGWVNGKNVTELRASLAEASKAGVDVSFRTPNATGEQLHHIIPAADPKASAVRERLMELGIHPNSVFNGVGMNTDVHRYIHNETYYSALALQLQKFTSTEDAAGFLDDIARHIDGLPAPSNAEEARRLAERVTQFIKQYQGG